MPGNYERGIDCMGVSISMLTFIRQFEPLKREVKPRVLKRQSLVNTIGTRLGGNKMEKRVV